MTPSGWVVVLLPLLGATAVATTAAREARRWVSPLAVGAAAATLVLAGWAAVTEASAGWRWSDRLSLGLDVVGLGRPMTVLVAAVALAVIASASASERDDPARARLLALLLVFTGAMLALVMAADLLTLLVAWELVGALSWALIAHDWRDPTRPSRALQALLTTRFGDLGLVAAAAVAIGSAGSAGYLELGSLTGWPAHVVAGGLLLAASAKSAQLPFSPWLFSAMAGPTPVSALLHSATMVAAGAYALARTVPLLGGAPWMAEAVAVVGLVTALVGGVVAFAQTDLKAALAASTSAQYGLIFVAVGAGSAAAAGAHLVTHAFFKSLLFLGAGLAVHATGTLHLGSLRLGRALPVTAGAFAVGVLALAAVPPLGGAASKEAILAAAAHQGPWLAAGVVVAAFLSALYAGRLAVLAYGPQPTGPDIAEHRRPGRTERASMLALAVATVALGVLWLPATEGWVERLSAARLFEPAAWELPTSLAAVALAGVVLARLARRHPLLGAGLAPPVQRFVAGWLALPVLSRRLVVDPTLALARGLATFDDRVIDAGVRAATWVPTALSRLLGWWGERSIDGAVQAVASGALWAGGASRRADEGGVDRAVEDLARATTSAGHHSRRLQSGFTHHYYVLVGAGLVVALVAAGLGR
ncbi:NADH-quinone oxidoreductase subunit L [soil metagenome]